MIQLTIYSRDGCHLCEDMLEHLEMLRQDHGFGIEIRDVDSNPDWLNAYSDLVPVLEYNGKQICHYFLDQASLLKVLEETG